MLFNLFNVGIASVLASLQPQGLVFFVEKSGKEALVPGPQCFQKVKSKQKKKKQKNKKKILCPPELVNSHLRRAKK